MTVSSIVPIFNNSSSDAKSGASSASSPPLTISSALASAFNALASGVGMILTPSEKPSTVSFPELVDSSSQAAVSGEASKPKMADLGEVWGIKVSPNPFDILSSSNNRFAAEEKRAKRIAQVMGTRASRGATLRAKYEARADTRLLFIHGAKIKSKASHDGEDAVIVQKLYSGVSLAEYNKTKTSHKYRLKNCRSA